MRFCWFSKKLSRLFERTGKKSKKDSMGPDVKELKVWEGGPFAEF